MKNLIPKRRFEEFKDSDPWEQRKLGELLDVSTGKLDANAMVEDGEYDFYTSGIKKYRIDIPAFEGPAITIAGNGATVGYMHLADGKFNAYQRTYVLEGFQADRQFLYSEISNRLPRKIAEEARTGNIPYIVMDMLTDLNISLPVTEEEQRKIGTFFSNLDNLITLHQRKLDKLKATKSAYQSEMFPKEGEFYPKRRFAGFTDPWEQCKLSDGTSKIGDGLHGTPVYADDGNVYFINGNNLVNGKIVITEETKCVTEDEQSKNDKALDDNTLLMSINGTIGNLAWYNGEKLMLGKSAAYITVSDFDKRFIYAYLQTPSIYNYFMSNLTGSTIKNLGLKTIRETKLLVPKREEQIQIGDFFADLDNLITLHQRKLDKLQALKQAYLSEMFV